MPAKKTAVRKPTAKTTKPRAAKKVAPKAKAAKVNVKAKAPTKRAHAPTPKPEQQHPMWRLLEAKKQQREAQQGQTHLHGERDEHRHLEHRQQMRFSKFAGPRRRAA